MAKTVTSPRKSRGRPSTGAESIHLRVLPDQSHAIDLWMRSQDDSDLTKAEAIRRLVDLGLVAKTKGRPRTLDHRQRASDMAGKAIDTMSDGDASLDDQAARKRRLLKGPAEFRELRKDRSRPKAK